MRGLGTVGVTGGMNDGTHVLHARGLYSCEIDFDDQGLGTAVTTCAHNSFLLPSQQVSDLEPPHRPIQDSE